MSSINLSKHKAVLESTFKEVANPHSKTDWAVFGYDGKSFDLKVVETGEDGFEEMVEELNGGKIMYAVCRVQDPNTNLPKIVFVNWQGEGVPANVKGVCANHLRDVNNFFRGCHVTINARSEDDLDYDALLDKVKSSSGANYSIHKEKAKPAEQIKPVGAVYRRVNPTQEIDTGKRDAFWSKQEKEEANRLEEERKKAEKDREIEEQRRKQREAKEEAVRDQIIRERTRSIEQQRSAQKEIEKKRMDDEKSQYQEMLREKERDDQEFRQRSDSERRRRLQEAQNLIGSRQETKVPLPHDDVDVQKKIPPPVVLPKSKPTDPVQMQESLEGKSPADCHETGHEIGTNDKHDSEIGCYESEDVQEVHLTPKGSEREGEDKEGSDNFTGMAPDFEEIGNNEAVGYGGPSAETDQVLSESHYTYTGICATALYDYQAGGDDEISFDPGDVIQEIDMCDEGWWKGKSPDGNYGLFPSNYVELMPDHGTTGGDVDASESQDRDGTRARALYDYEASDETEITFDPGDIIVDIEKIDEGWWRGTGPRGNNGLFPANYVEEI